MTSSRRTCHAANTKITIAMANRMSARRRFGLLAVVRIEPGMELSLIGPHRLFSKHHPTFCDGIQDAIHRFLGRKPRSGKRNVRHTIVRKPRLKPPRQIFPSGQNRSLRGVWLGKTPLDQDFQRRVQEYYAGLFESSEKL